MSRFCFGDGCSWEETASLDSRYVKDPDRLAPTKRACSTQPALLVASVSEAPLTGSREQLTVLGKKLASVLRFTSFHPFMMHRSCSQIPFRMCAYRCSMNSIAIPVRRCFWSRMVTVCETDSNMVHLQPGYVLAALGNFICRKRAG